MAIRNRNMTIDAKINHFISSEITLLDTAADHYPTLRDVTRDIILVDIFTECSEDMATDAGTVNIGTAADADKHGIITVPITDNAGDYTAVASILDKTLVKNTPLRISHIDKGASAGKVFVHVWYYFVDTATETEQP